MGAGLPKSLDDGCYGPRLRNVLNVFVSTGARESERDPIFLLS